MQYKNINYITERYGILSTNTNIILYNNKISSIPKQFKYILAEASGLNINIDSRRYFYINPNNINRIEQLEYSKSTRIHFYDKTVLVVKDSAGKIKNQLRKLKLKNILNEL